MFLKRFLKFIFRERGREGEREINIDVREKHQLKHQSVASCTPATSDLACSPGTCPVRELNP